MTDMKKFIVIVAALLLGFQAKAQIIADAGFEVAFEKTRNDLGYYHPSSMFGLYAGANYYYSLDELVDGLAVLPGANLSVLIGRNFESRDFRERELALNIPLQASYTHELNENIKVFGQTGPAIQLALVHKVRDTTTGTTYPLLNKNNTFGYARQPFNIYWGFAAGAEVNDMLRIHVGIDLGLVNLNRRLEHSTINKVTRNFLHIGVGYLF